VSNGKRFIAYELVKRLQEERKNEILEKLAAAVISSDKDRGKKHQVFERSFDCKPITSAHFFLEKLDYIHNNPCSGVWKLWLRIRLTINIAQPNITCREYKVTTRL
jgi:hypothetical protein